MKSYIIRLKDNSLSRSLAKDVYNAAQTFEYNAEYFDAINGIDGVKFLQDRNLQLVTTVQNIDWTPGTIGCFCSHYRLWEICLESNEPLVILEHDGVPIRNPRSIIHLVDDVCHLDAFIPFNSKYGEDSDEYFNTYNREVKTKNTPGVESYPPNTFYGDVNNTGSCFRGTYGYIVTPKGAKKLIDFVHENGVYPSDRTVCEKAVKLQRSKCSYVRYHPFYRTIKKQREVTTRN